MKVLVISPLQPPIGGIAKWTEAYLDSKNFLDYEVTLVNSNIGEKKRFFRTSSRFFRIRKEFKQNINNGINLVHVCSSGNFLSLLKDLYFSSICRKLKVKIIIHYHCDLDYTINNSISLIILKKVVKNTSKLFVLNNSSLSLIKLYSNEKGVVVPNFIKNKSFSPISIHSLDSCCIKLAFVGRFEYKKGSDILIEIAKIQKSFEIHIIGEAKESDVNENQCKNLIFHGKLESCEVFKVLKNSDIFLFPSRTEGFPMAVLEAMSIGLPIISSNVGAIPDMLEEKGGILISDFKASSYIKEITNLINDPEKLISMSNYNIEKVMNYYTDEVVMKEINNLYSKILERN